MALIGGYSVLNKAPGRSLSGPSTAHAAGVGPAAGTKASWAKPSDWRKWSLADFSGASFTSLNHFAAKPSGYYPSGAYALADKAGYIGSVNQLLGSGALASAGTLGLPTTAALSGSSDLVATGQLVVSGAATLTGSGSLSGSVVAVLVAAASLSGLGTLSGATTAKGHAAASLSGLGTVSLTSYATGALAASITPAVILTAEQFAQQLLDLEDVEGGLTVREALRLMSATMAGKISGAAGATVTIRNAVADTKDRIVATVDSSGNRTAITYDLS